MNDSQGNTGVVDLVKYLDSWMDNMLQRPHMYVSCPAAMEDIVSLIDQIKIALTNTEVGPNDLMGYSAFLYQKGFGSATFCNRRRPQGLTEVERALFSELAEFIGEYRKKGLVRIKINDEIEHKRGSSD